MPVKGNQNLYFFTSFYINGSIKIFFFHNKQIDFFKLNWKKFDT